MYDSHVNHTTDSNTWRRGAERGPMTTVLDKKKPITRLPIRKTSRQKDGAKPNANSQLLFFACISFIDSIYTGRCVLTSNDLLPGKILTNFLLQKDDNNVFLPEFVRGLSNGYT